MVLLAAPIGCETVREAIRKRPATLAEVAMDEACEQLRQHVQPPIPLTPGQPAGEDDKYERRGARVLFTLFSPLLDRRRASHSERYARIDRAEQAHRLAQRLNLVHTPHNGSWLNVAEIEFTVRSRQCLNRRLGDAQRLEQYLHAGTTARHRDASRVTRQFATTNA